MVRRASGSLGRDMDLETKAMLKGIERQLEEYARSKKTGSLEVLILAGKPKKLRAHGDVEIPELLASKN